jgi:hypothetical protein
MLGTMLCVSIALIVSSEDGVCDIVPDHRPRERGRISRARRGVASGEGDDRTRFTPASLFGRDERIRLNYRDRNLVWILLMILQVPRAPLPTPLSLAMAHSWIIRFLEHRIADKRII